LNESTTEISSLEGTSPRQTASTSAHRVPKYSDYWLRKKKKKKIKDKLKLTFTWIKGSTPRMESNMASPRYAVLSLKFTSKVYALRRAESMSCTKYATNIGTLGLKSAATMINQFLTTW